MPFLTPEAPDKLVTIRAVIPDTLLPSFIGAWLELWDADHWESFGSLSPDVVFEYIGEVFSTIEEFPSLPSPLTGKAVKFLYVKVDGTLLYIVDESGNPLFIIGEI